MFERVIRDYEILRDTYVAMGVAFPLAGKLPSIIQVYSLIKPIAALIEYAQQSTSYSPLCECSGIICQTTQCLTAQFFS